MTAADLRKATEDAEAQFLAELKKAQQLGLFDGDVHHVAYDRTTASGKLVHVEAKGFNGEKIKAGQRGLEAGEQHPHSKGAKGSGHDRGAAKQLKTILESDDFGMTEQGGNGRVKANADGTLTVRDGYFYGGNRAHDRLHGHWKEGGSHARYFAEEHGLHVKVLGSGIHDDRKDPHAWVKLAVTKGTPVEKSLSDTLPAAGQYLLKSHVRAHSRRNKSGSVSVVKEHEDSRVNHGHMRFTYRDGMGNKNTLHVTAERIRAGGGPDQRTPMGLSNYTFKDPAPDGYLAAEKRLKNAIRNAYNTSGGDPQKVLQAIKTATRLHDSWSLHSHDKPVPAPKKETPSHEVAHQEATKKIDAIVAGMNLPGVKVKTSRDENIVTISVKPAEDVPRGAITEAFGQRTMSGQQLQNNMKLTGDAVKAIEKKIKASGIDIEDVWSESAGYGGSVGLVLRDKAEKSLDGSGQRLQKAHVKGYTRTTASGKAVQVAEHDDSRKLHMLKIDFKKDDGKTYRLEKQILGGTKEEAIRAGEKEGSMAGRKLVTVDHSQHKSQHAPFFASKGMRGSEFGMHDKTESKVTLKDAHDYAIKNGYRKTKEVKAFNMTHHVYHRPGGPYTDDHLSFSTTNGTHVRDVQHDIVTDKS